MNAPEASVIIVGYNSLRYLEVCLAAVLAQEYAAPFEVIFVDNDSGDGSAEFVRRRFPRVRVIESGANLGYAGGNNLGAREARGEVLVFLNPDTRAEPGWLAELIRPLAADASIGMTTSKIVLMDDPGTINTCGNEISLAGITTCRRAGEPSAAVVDDEEVAAVSGASCAIRAALFHELGGFDERFWMYMEDTDLSWSVRLAGYHCVLAAKSVAAHHYTFCLSPAKTFTIERNRYLMLLKQLNLATLLALIPLFIVGELTTWGWAALCGPAHLRAKLQAAAWVAANIAVVRQARRRVQQLRRVPDLRLLRAHPAAPPIAEVNAGMIGRLVRLVLVPLAAGAAAASIALLSLAPHADSPRFSDQDGAAPVRAGS